MYVFKTIRQDVERMILANGLIIVIVEAVELYQRRWGLTVVPEFVKFILVCIGCVATKKWHFYEICKVLQSSRGLDFN